MPHASQPLVCISIVNWNTTPSTLTLLRSLEELTYRTFRVIVVDNNSQEDPTAAIVQHHPEVTVIRSPENLGYAGGHRIAWGKAKNDGAELLWLLNPDVILEPDTLGTLVSAYCGNPAALYGSVPLDTGRTEDIGSATVRSADKYIHTPYREPLIARKSYKSTFSDIFPNNQNRIVAALHGCSWLLPLAIAKEHGFLDESYFLYAEEIDYCLRLATAGIPSILVADSHVFHHGEGATRGNHRLSAIMTYYQVRNHLLLVRRFQSTYEYICLLLRKALLIVPYAIKPPLHPRRAWCVFLGIRDALMNRRGKTLSPEDVLRLRQE